jgi:HPt (histidine-containing phosphotransfer) domain-containing protein
VMTRQLRGARLAAPIGLNRSAEHLDRDGRNERWMGAAPLGSDHHGMTPRFERTDETPTLDRELFDSLRSDLGDDAMANLVMLFSERAPQLRELGRATRRGDGAEVAKISHSLRGGAAILAAKRLAELAEELEERGNGDLEEGSERLANEATMEFERAVSVMRAELAAVPGDAVRASERSALSLSSPG